MIMYTLKNIAGLAALTLAATNSSEAAKPNIIFILADDLGWADLPVYGNRFNEAHNLTKLAEEGIRFTNAYSTCPVCSPSRASIMSGQYPARVGVIDFIPGHWRPFEEVTVPSNRTQFLPEEIITLGESLQKAGYKTGYFGKWHLGDEKLHHPLNQGFEEANVGQGYFNTRFNPPREQSAEKIISQRLTDYSIEFMEKNKKEPFFLFLSHWDVHCLLDADKHMIDKYLKKPKAEGYPSNAIYAAMIENVDNSTGRIMAKLKNLGIDKNTIVFFFSDNGGIITENKYPGITEELMPMIAPSKSEIYANSLLRYVVTSNAPLRNQKGTVYEGGIREPLIVRWPGKIKKGTVTNAIVSGVDFYPTLLEIAGAEKPENQILDGKSMVSVLLRNECDKDRAIFWHYPVYHHDVPAGAVRKGNWKLVENLVTRTVSLYDLETDISETTDISKAFPEKTRELYSLLKQWQKEVKAEFPVPNPDFNAERRLEWGKHPDRE
jgi:arylsulfatase A